MFAGILAACGQSPAAPSRLPRLGGDPPLAPAPDASKPTVSGVVYEHTLAGPRPLARLLFTVWWSTDSPWDYGGSDPSKRVLSDDSGRYAASAISGTLIAFEIPVESGFRAPCPSGFDSFQEKVTTDIHLVSDAILSSTGVPASVPTPGPNVSGKVTERRSSEKNAPVAGASIELAGDLNSVFRSVTLTNASGNFLVCANPAGTGTDQTMWITVSKDGYRPVSQAVQIGVSDKSVSLQLIRH
jgi:hypothetical protein